MLFYSIITLKSDENPPFAVDPLLTSKSLGHLAFLLALSSPLGLKEVVEKLIITEKLIIIETYRETKSCVKLIKLWVGDIFRMNPFLHGESEARRTPEIRYDAVDELWNYVCCAFFI